MGTRSPPVCQNTNPSIRFFLHFWEVDSIAASEMTPGPGVEACWCSQKRKTCFQWALRQHGVARTTVTG